MTENTGLDGPLLSRFDILLVLTDVRNPEWDEAVSGHILAAHSKVGTVEAMKKAWICFLLFKLSV